MKYAIIGGIAGHMHFTVPRNEPPTKLSPTARAALETLDSLTEHHPESTVRCECGWSGRRSALAAHVKLAAMGVRFR